MKGKTWLAILVVLALLAGGFYAYEQTHPDDSSAPSVGGSVSSPLPPSDQQRLETALNSDSPATQATALTQDFAAVVHGQAVMPRGARITFRPETFRKSGNDAVVNATVRQNGQDSATALFLSRVAPDQPWLVLSSLPQVATKTYTTELKSVTPTAGQRAMQQTDCSPVAKGKKPVLFVHGFNEGPSVWGALSDPQSLAGVVGSIGGIQVADPFNYESAELQWVTDPKIGAALATRVLCLSQSSRAAGNDGKVVVIAHSMGGLALKEAIKEQPQVAADLGLVVTIATPNDGSVIDSQLTQAVIDLCGVSVALSPLIAAACGGGLAGLLTSASALRGLQVGSPELKALPDWPPYVPVYAIAGNIRPTYTFLGQVSYGAYSGSDTLVTTGSALHGQTVDGLGGTLAPLLCSGDAPWVLPLGLTNAPCDHNQLLRNEDAERMTVQEVQMYLHKTHQPAPSQPKPQPPPQPSHCEQVLDAGDGWQHAQTQVTIQNGTVACTEAIQTVKDFLSSEIGSSGANQIGIWGCALRYQPPAKVGGFCENQKGKFTFVGM